MKSIDINADMNSRIRYLLNDEILNFGREELITAYEMIKLIKIPKKKLVKEKQGLDFDFSRARKASLAVWLMILLTLKEKKDYEIIF